MYGFVSENCNLVLGCYGWGQTSPATDSKNKKMQCITAISKRRTLEYVAVTFTSTGLYKSDRFSTVDES
jgi:hypothetical protein